MGNWRPLEEPNEPRPVRASLDQLAQKLGAPKAAALEALFARWADVVGEVVAAHARPRALRKGVLTVAVDDPAWATELRSISARILDRCAEVAGAGVVDQIDVKVAPNG
jgi:predicted nucleic acid-binding Zn ribbon protein